MCILEIFSLGICSEEFGDGCNVSEETANYYSMPRNSVKVNGSSEEEPFVEGASMKEDRSVLGNNMKEFPIVEVSLPETAQECLEQSKPTTNVSSDVVGNPVKHCQGKPEYPEFLEASKAEQSPCKPDIKTMCDYGELQEDAHQEVDDGIGDDDELVYVEESQPLLPGPLDNIPLKFESETEDQYTLGEVAEKVFEINVDDPYGLCSLLAAEKKKEQSKLCWERGGRRKMMYDYTPTNKLRGVRSVKNKHLRASKLKVLKYPYKCSRCDSWFVDSCDLKVHMSTHTAKSFKSVKEFIHEKIFKTPEVDKVVINAPIEFKPVTASTGDNLNESITSKQYETSEDNVHIYDTRQRNFKGEEIPRIAYKEERDSSKHSGIIKKEEHLHKNGYVHPEIIYYEHIGHRPWLPLDREITLACSLCNMHFKNMDSLSIHMQVHNQIHEQVRNPEKTHLENPTTASPTRSPPPSSSPPIPSTNSSAYKCTSCTASFGTSFNLKRHMRIHTGTRPYKCDQCQSAFITKAQLTTHMRTHTGEKPYQCDICGGKFIQQNNLKRHIMTHTGEKPFKCDKCSAAFISSSDLKRHIRVHTGEKPYKCIHCNKGFTTSGNLSSHYKMHTGEKPYKCQQCDASFSHQSNLKTHVKRHNEQQHLALAES